MTPFQHQQKLRNQILGSYNNVPEIQKAKQEEEIGKTGEENDIEKGKGEGSKGGKVIGHTKSGKPVYEKHDHESHKEFTHQDHAEAAVLHHKLAHEGKDMKALVKHSKASVHHWEQHYGKGGNFKTEDSEKLRTELDAKDKKEESK